MDSLLCDVSCAELARTKLALEGNHFNGVRPVVRVRDAEPADAPVLEELISEMARHHGVEVNASEDRLLADGFGERPRFHGLIAEVDHEAAGYAIYFDCYSSFYGGGIFLDDLFVRDPYRGTGVGRMLLSRLAKTAEKRNCIGIMLNVLDWNEPALRLFKRAGATELVGRKSMCLSGAALRDVAS